MTEHFSDLDIVARTLYGEARGELKQFGLCALEGVAGVIWNRWQGNPGRFGVSPREVCLKPYQFSCWNTNDPNRAILTQPILTDAAYGLCQMVAETFLSGNAEDITQGANHYHNRWMCPPEWALDQRPLMDIGNHRFYRL